MRLDCLFSLTSSVSPLHNTLGAFDAFGKVHVHQVFPGALGVKSRWKLVIPFHYCHQILVQAFLRHWFCDVIVDTDSKLVVSLVEGSGNDFCFHHFGSVRQMFGNYSQTVFSTSLVFAFSIVRVTAGTA